MNYFLLFASMLLCLSCAQAETKPAKSSIPLSVFDVTTERVDKEIIRTIIAYPDDIPEITIERIATPDLTLLEVRKIDSITLEAGKSLI